MENQPVDEMNYEKLAQDALRGVIPRALRKIQKDGPPGAHHFYITIATKAEGVRMPPEVLAKYPGEITVVLQHQFWGLEVWEDRFDVQLKFGGVAKTLVVPYAAVTRFYDPSVQFLLQFDPPAPASPEQAPLDINWDAADAPKVSLAGNVVPLFNPKP